MTYTAVQRDWPQPLTRIDYIPLKQPAVSVGTGIRMMTQRIKDTVNTPKWTTYVQGGFWKPINPYFFSTKKRVFGDGGLYLKIFWIPTGDSSWYYGVDGRYYDGLVPYLEPSQAVRVAMRDNMAARCLSKIKNQKVNLGVFAAELPQTLSLFGDAATRIAKAYDAVRRKAFKEAFEALRCKPSKRLNAKKTAAQNWLELQYGWVPLLDDVYGAALELEDAFEKVKQKPPIFSVGAKQRWQNEDSILQPGGYAGMRVDRRCIYDAKMKISYTVDVEAAAYLGRIGLTNPFSVAWEKLPWSFVVDWFLPIGRFLNNLDADLGCTFVNGSNSGSTYSHLSAECKATYDVGNYRYVWDWGSFPGRFFKYERGSESGFPTWSLPHFKNPLSAQHCANALALLTQVFSRK